MNIAGTCYSCTGTALVVSPHTYNFDGMYLYNSNIHTNLLIRFLLPWWSIQWVLCMQSRQLF